MRMPIDAYNDVTVPMCFLNPQTIKRTTDRPNKTSTTKVCSITSDIVNASAIPLLVGHMLSAGVDEGNTLPPRSAAVLTLASQSAWALANIAADADGIHRRDILDCGAFPAVLQLAGLRSTAGTSTGTSTSAHSAKSLEMRQNVLFLLSNLCRPYNAELLNWRLLLTALPVLAKLLYDKDTSTGGIVEYACLSIGYLVDTRSYISSVSQNDRVAAVLAAGVCRRVVEIAVNNTDAAATGVLSAALTAISNFVTVRLSSGTFALYQITAPRGVWRCVLRCVCV